MKAIMYGAGNIGRGFIGAMFSQSGYEVTFIDVAEAVVSRLNRDHGYPQRIVSNEGFTDVPVGQVNAINGRDEEAVINAIAEADIMATAVGVNVLKFVAPLIAAGLKKRFLNPRPLNIIICENLMDANKVLEGMLKEHMTEQERGLMDTYVGLVEASIGRMVPIQRPEMQDGNPLRVCVEKYDYLPVDRDAFVGGIPELHNLVPFSPFDFYIKRKLYIHNMGHATCAYLGRLAGAEYIYESIAQPNIRLAVHGAMLESAFALSARYGVNAGDISMHIDDLITRFQNAALGDTCARVGADARRKLSPADRMIGSAGLCLAERGVPVFICLGTGAAVHAFLAQENMEQTEKNAKKALTEVGNLSKDSALLPVILEFYALFAAGAPLDAVLKTADSLRAKLRGPII
ncbi:MAG TPA: mannitol dehydrogenase [Feifaniaceae bacterium]|nr:mannitol dehydrogenase [Feifaniaceae bacterium]